MQLNDVLPKDLWVKRMKSNKVIINFLWQLAERVGAQLVGVIVSIILARLLMPEDYGTIALMNVFISILNIFVNGGLGSGLVQKKDADDLDFSSFFYVNTLFCGVLYLVLFFVAPFVANFYSNPQMIWLMRVLGLNFLISGLKSIQVSYVSRNMLFKKFFWATLGGTVLAAVVGIYMAQQGYGAWALVVQSVLNNAIDTVILWITVKWRPKLMFSFQRLRFLLSYGSKLLFSHVIDVLYDNLWSLIIGKIYSSSDLAYYNRGRNWPNLIVENTNSSITSVLLPSMSKEQDDLIRLKAMTRRAIKTSTYIMAPMLLGLAFIGEPLVRLLLTERWMRSIFYMRIFCVTFVFYPIHTANLTAIKAMGRSDIYLKLEIIKKMVGLLALVVSAPISVRAMGYSLLFTSLASQIINSWPNKKLLNYGYLEQLKDILPGILLAVVMGCCIYPIQWLGLPDVVTLLIQVPLGAVIYIGASALLKLESFTYLWGIVKPILGRFIKK